jgi:hypothetical protein
MARDGAPLAILATLIVAFITLGAGACFWALDRMHGFERSCQQAGGHRRHLQGPDVRVAGRPSDTSRPVRSRQPAMTRGPWVRSWGPLASGYTWAVTPYASGSWSAASDRARSTASSRLRRPDRLPAETWSAVRCCAEELLTAAEVDGLSRRCGLRSAGSARSWARAVTHGAVTATMGAPAAGPTSADRPRSGSA